MDINTKVTHNTIALMTNEHMDHTCDVLTFAYTIFFGLAPLQCTMLSITYDQIAF